MREVPLDWTNALEPIAFDDWDYARAAHLLERAGFGGTPEEIERLAAMQPTEAVDYLVDYEELDCSALPEFEESGIYPHGHKLVVLQQLVDRVLATGMVYGIEASQEGPLPYQPGINEFYALLFGECMEMQRACMWWAERMLLTPRPLEEKLTLFWHDHFATSQIKVLNFELMLRQNDTLRGLANGNVRDLLVAIAQDPAMLIWLDNRSNVRGRPNENFARELMELYTMGEGCGYGERDVREMARAFTGWTMGPIHTVDDDGAFVDDPRLHDDGEKTFLGRTGDFDGYDAIDIVLEQPATATFLAAKLYRYFVRDELDSMVNDRLANELRESNYELRPLLKTIFLSKDFYSRGACGAQIKSPVAFLVSTSRKLGLEHIPGIPDFVETSGAKLGQLLFHPPNPAGWTGNEAWINGATLLARGHYVHEMLFPDPETYIAPDKAVPEAYRRIPIMFSEYRIVPHLWNAEARRMEPVSNAEYDRYLLRVAGQTDDGAAAAGTFASREMMELDPSEPKSKINLIPQGESYSLAMGVYQGYVEAFNRVEALPREPARLDFVALLAGEDVETVEHAVDCLVRRFLRVPLEGERRATLIAHLREQLGGDEIDVAHEGTERALRSLVYLILSTPEYQLG